MFVRQLLIERWDKRDSRPSLPVAPVPPEDDEEEDEDEEEEKESPVDLDQGNGYLPVRTEEPLVRSN